MYSTGSIQIVERIKQNTKNKLFFDRQNREQSQKILFVHRLFCKEITSRKILLVDFFRVLLSMTLWTSFWLSGGLGINLVSLVLRYLSVVSSLSYANRTCIAFD